MWMDADAYAGFINVQNSRKKVISPFNSPSNLLRLRERTIRASRSPSCAGMCPIDVRVEARQFSGAKHKRNIPGSRISIPRTRTRD